MVRVLMEGMRGAEGFMEMPFWLVHYDCALYKSLMNDEGLSRDVSSATYH